MHNRTCTWVGNSHIKSKKMYYRKIKKSSRKEMVEFLENHFKYWTMNPWNLHTSYAHNVKIHNLRLTSEQEDKFFEMMGEGLLTEFWNDVEELFINEFREETGYTIGSNGRSDGYLVLYDCEKQYLDYKSVCRYCGQFNYKSVEESGNCICGKCGKEGRINLQHQIYRWNTLVHSIDDNEDFNDTKEWPLYKLRDRVELVQKFDKLCDTIREYLIEFLDSHEIAEEEYTAKRMTLIEK